MISMAKTLLQVNSCPGPDLSDMVPYHPQLEPGAKPRVAILLAGTRGDHQPAVPLAQALKQRGAEVRIFAKSSFVDTLFKKFGMQDLVEKLPGADFEQLLTHPEYTAASESGDENKVWHAWDRLRREEYDDNACLDAYVAGCQEFKPTVIVWHHSLTTTAIVCCKFCQCPSIPLCYFPATPTERIPNLDCAPRDVNASRWWKWLTHRQELCQSRPTKSVAYYAAEKYDVDVSASGCWDLFHNPKRPVLCAWSPTQGPRPDDYHKGVQGPLGLFRLDAAAKSKAFSISEAISDLPGFIERAKREDLCYISWGSMRQGTDKQLTRLAVGALKKAGCKGVIQGNYSDLCLAKLDEDDEDEDLHAYAAENVYFIPKGESLSHAWLFPLMGCCVIHGGVGTIASCLEAGTPMVVTGICVDQFYWGQQLENQGAGVHGPALNEATGDSLGKCVAKVLKDMKKGGKMAAKAKSMGEQIDGEKGAEDAADFLMAFCLGTAEGFESEDESGDDEAWCCRGGRHGSEDSDDN